MKTRFVIFTAAALAAGALLVPFGAARAQEVSVRISTPEFGIRIGSPYPAPVYAPVYSPPVYSPPVYSPPVVVAPAPVYYEAPRYVIVPPPRVVVGAPVVYRAPWVVPPRHSRAWRHWHRREFD
ncbi:MAG: hypothetical protein ACM3PU_04440 [Gemmatimonadota bacterium]